MDPLLSEGRELLLNRISGRHRDSQDPKLAYAGLYAAGNFTSGGHLFFPQLNLRVHLLPGDFVLLRGRVLEHQIEAWEGGQRISIPHFDSHQFVEGLWIGTVSGHLKYLH